MEIGTVESVDIDHQMRTAYLDYAMSVIVARALPDARDGLKPVHRRILYAMHDLGMRSNTAYKKSARIVGEVLGKYHPHGDLSVYDAMARMAQDFSMRYLLVDGQGNFGSVDGDSPAAMRYTEARLGAMAEELLVDIDKNTVDFGDNFDATLQEPLVLPARLPNLLLNGSSGIAVGMATNIPPHNLGELVGALNYLIDNYDAMDDVSIDDLMKFVTGPDFPTGGIIVGMESIRQAYITGRGRIVMRGLARIEEMKAGRFAIVITEIPFQVNKSTLIERIAELVREGKIEDISDLRDESDRKGMTIMVELKRGAEPHKVLNQLYKYTALQSTFGIHMLALVKGEPRVLPLKRSLQIYIEHRQEVIVRRSQFELDKARRRAHVLDGLLIALNNLDAVIATIRQSPDAETARENLMARFSLSEIQAQAILDLQLRRLAALERHKIEEEHRTVLDQIAYLEDLLANPKKILAVIQTDLKEIGAKYGDARRTRIKPEAAEEFREEDLVADEPVLVTLTQRGYIKRLSPATYRSANRGRRGVSGQTMKEEDEMILIIPARTLNTILFFTDRGKVYSVKAHQIPEAGRTDRGSSIINVISISENEHVTAAVTISDFSQNQFVTMATFGGRLKRMPLSDFANVRQSGIITISLDEGDQLGWVRVTNGKDHIIMVTHNGNALRISEEVIRVMGRQAGGVSGIKLRAGDRLASMEVVEPGGYMLIVTEVGFGKRTPLTEYKLQRRGGSGVKAIDQKHTDKIGYVAVGRVVQDEDEITLITSGGMVLRFKVGQIRPSGRGTRGIHLMDVVEGNTVVSIARLSAASLPRDAMEPEKEAA